MGIDFLVSHDDKTMIKNLFDGSIKLYDHKQDVKDRIEEIIGSSIISGMTRLKSEKDEQISKIVKFTTMTDTPANTITFENDAIAKYTDIMSEMNNRRITDTYCKLEELIETGNFNVINIIIDEYQNGVDDCSFSYQDGAILYHLIQNKYGTIESRDQKIISDIIDKFISIYGLSSVQPVMKNHGIIIGNDNKTIISNEEVIKSMINRKVGNYGKRI